MRKGERKGKGEEGTCAIDIKKKKRKLRNKIKSSRYNNLYPRRAMKAYL